MFLIVTLLAGVAASAALADVDSDRRDLLRAIDDNLTSIVSELSGVKSDSDDGDIRDAEGYADKVRDLVSKLDSIKGDDSKAREVVDRYPGYVERFKRANAALRGMKGYQTSNVTVMKVCQDKNNELVAIARDFENRNDPDGLEKLPRLADELKNLTVRFMEEAERFRSQMEDWKRTAQSFDVSDGKWNDVRNVMRSESEDINSYWRSDHDTAKTRCKDLVAGRDHPVVREVLGKLSNSSAGRKELMDNVTRLVGEMASRIKDVPGASGTSSVDSVRERLDAIDTMLASLDRAKGADPKAKDIVEKWPNIAREARASIEPLKELKEFHHALDDLPGKCKDMESKLEGFISSNGDDADGIEKIPDFANDLGSPVIVGLAKAKERFERMKSARENAQRFTRSEGPWSDVSAAYRSSSVTIFDFFKERYESTEAACKDIVRTKDHPKVKTAVERLRSLTGSAADRLTRRAGELRARWSTAQTTYQTFEKDFWALQNDSKKWRKFDVDELDQLIVFICGKDHERDGDEADRLSGEMRSKVVAEARGRREGYLKASDDLGTRLPLIYRDLAGLNEEIDAAVKEFESVKKIDKSVVQSLRDLSKEVYTLREAKRATFFSMHAGDRQSFLNTSDDVLNGENNPRTAASSKYGRQKHRDLQGDSTYACAEKEYAAGGGFADCVSHKQCVVWEFKPDSYQMEDALKQATGYLSGVNNDFSKGNSAGKPWEHCWKSDGPSGGAGYVARGYLYPKCTASR